MSNCSLDRLSKSEQRVALLCARGLSNKAIGTELYLSVNTIKTHLRQCFEKLAVHNKAELVATLMLDDRYRGLVTEPVAVLTLLPDVSQLVG